MNEWQRTNADRPEGRCCRCNEDLRHGDEVRWRERGDLVAHERCWSEPINRSQLSAALEIAYTFDDEDETMLPIIGVLEALLDGDTTSIAMGIEDPAAD